MTDERCAIHIPLEALNAWRIDLESQVDSVRREIQERTALLEAVEEKLSLVRRLVELNGEHRTGDPKPSLGTSRELRPPTGGELVEDATELILKESGVPMHISAIRGALLERGCPIPGRADDANIIVRLSKYPERFIRTARGTYALPDWGIPAMRSKRKRQPARKPR